jgi:hypothetical protein
LGAFENEYSYRINLEGMGSGLANAGMHMNQFAQGNTKPKKAASK